MNTPTGVLNPVYSRQGREEGMGWGREGGRRGGDGGGRRRTGEGGGEGMGEGGREGGKVGDGEDRSLVLEIIFLRVTLHTGNVSRSRLDLDLGLLIKLMTYDKSFLFFYQL